MTAVAQPTLTVWKFPTALGAAQAARGLEKLGSDQALVVENAAFVAWASGTATPRVHPLQLPGSPDTLSEGFWGLLFGIVFFMPLLGAAVGSTTGTLTRPLADVGIRDTFINKVRDLVTPGSSALFALTAGDDDEIRTAVAAYGPTEVLFTHLTPEQLRALRAVFGRA